MGNSNILRSEGGEEGEEKGLYLKMKSLPMEISKQLMLLQTLNSFKIKHS